MRTRAAAAILLVSALAYGGLSTAAITNTVGDADCFGLGGNCADGDLFVTTLGGAFFTDYRSAGDIATAPHTDFWFTGNRTWTHAYASSGTPLSAQIELLIAGFADIGAVDLQADGTTISTFNFSGQNQTVHELLVAVPLSFIDGSTVFSLVGPSGDGYILDHTTLTVATAVPEPATLALLGLGLAGLGFARRHKQ